MGSEAGGSWLPSVSGRQRWPMVVITAVDRMFSTGDPSLSRVRPALAALRASNIPVVCVSDRDASEVVSLRQRIGLDAPFICHLGHQLHIPHGYFWASPPASTRHQPADIICTEGAANAVAIVASLYRACQSDVMVVGTAASPSERDLLRHVDVPILVRPEGADDFSSALAFPAAYVTHRSGLDGWSEAILGWPG